MSREQIIWVALRGILLVIGGSLIMACATSTPSVVQERPQETQTKSVFETCQVVQDQELAEMRGCYDSIYSFGMTIEGTMDLAKNTFKISTGADGQIHGSGTVGTNGGEVSYTGTQVAFKDQNVSFLAGMGAGGVMSMIQVNGNNVSVVNNVLVNLTIKNAVNAASVPTAGNTLRGLGVIIR